MTKITFTYTNWRGETSTRTATPYRMRFGTSEWHKEPQALMLAYDYEKKAEREFAIRDMSDVTPDLIFSLVEYHVLPWDAGSNRAYEPVEKRAKQIYDARLAVDHKGTRWPWLDGGNSLKQDEARVLARRELRESGHIPESAAPGSFHEPATPEPSQEADRG
jgi:hypothetical protein